MKRYFGPLGNFTFDENQYKLIDGQLIYCGEIKNGAIIGEIPEGIEDCSYMFANCQGLLFAPRLPKSCIAANYMFSGCENLQTLPDINEALMDSDDFNCTTMFAGCTKLQKLCIDVETKEKVDVYMCACERSVYYPMHIRKMKKKLMMENSIRESDYKQTHKYRLKLAEKLKLPINIRKRNAVLPDVLYHTILLDDVTSQEVEASEHVTIKGGKINPSGIANSTIISQSAVKNTNTLDEPQRMDLGD